MGLGRMPGVRNSAHKKALAECDQGYSHHQQSLLSPVSAAAGPGPGPSGPGWLGKLAQESGSGLSPRRRLAGMVCLGVIPQASGPAGLGRWPAAKRGQCRPVGLLGTGISASISPNLLSHGGTLPCLSQCSQVSFFSYASRLDIRPGKPP